MTYENGYRSEHSLELRDYFPISNRGVDYYNPNNISIEFKECFSEKKEAQWFKVRKRQLEESKYVVFCLLNEEFYILRSSHLLKKYSFNTYGKRVNLRIDTIRKNSIFETNDYIELKEVIDKLR